MPAGKRPDTVTSLKCSAGIPMGTPDPAPFLIPDCRRPGQPMATLPLKLPAEALAQLQAQSDRLRCSRAALARALLLQGLEQLEPAHPAREVA
jgi:hypothetical protein